MIETLTSPSVKRALVLYTAHRRAATSRDRNKKNLRIETGAAERSFPLSNYARRKRVHKFVLNDMDFRSSHAASALFFIKQQRMMLK